MGHEDAWGPEQHETALRGIMILSKLKTPKELTKKGGEQAHLQAPWPSPSHFLLRWQQKSQLLRSLRAATGAGPASLLPPF